MRDYVEELLFVRMKVLLVRGEAMPLEKAHKQRRAFLVEVTQKRHCLLSSATKEPAPSTQCQCL